MFNAIAHRYSLPADDAFESTDELACTDSPSHSLWACLLQLHFRRHFVLSRPKVSVLIFFPSAVTLAVRWHIMKTILMACMSENAVQVQHDEQVIQQYSTAVSAGCTHTHIRCYMHEATRHDEAWFTEGKSCDGEPRTRACAY